MNIDLSIQRAANVSGSSPVCIAKYSSFDDLHFDPKGGSHFIVFPVAEVNKPVMNALHYAKQLGGQIIAVQILLDFSDAERTQDQWKLHDIDVPLVVLDSPDRLLLEPLTALVDEILRRHSSNIVTIILPVLADLKWWHRFLHNQTARLIEGAFQNKARVVTVRVPFYFGVPLINKRT